MIAPTEEAATLTKRLANSIAARVLPGSFFNCPKVCDPFLSSYINVLTRKRDREKIAASIPEKKALKPRNNTIKAEYIIILLVQLWMLDIDYI